MNWSRAICVRNTLHRRHSNELANYVLTFGYVRKYVNAEDACKAGIIDDGDVDVADGNGEIWEKRGVNVVCTEEEFNAPVRICEARTFSCDLQYTASAFCTIGIN